MIFNNISILTSILIMIMWNKIERMNAAKLVIDTNVFHFTYILHRKKNMSTAKTDEVKSDENVRVWMDGW
jgi:hypothetical protein